VSSALESFEQLRLTGLEAYDTFYRFVTDAEVLDQSARGEGRDVALQFRNLVETLPAPVPELPLRVITNVANHAANGDLENHYLLQSATGREDGAPLRDWLQEAKEAVTLLAPETLGRELLWLRWVPPPRGEPFDPGRISFNQLSSIAAQFASALGAPQA
jgi:hypothetical protein